VAREAGQDDSERLPCELCGLLVKASLFLDHVQRHGLGIDSQGVAPSLAPGFGGYRLGSAIQMEIRGEPAKLHPFFEGIAPPPGFEVSSKIVAPAAPKVSRWRCVTSAGVAWRRSVALADRVTEPRGAETNQEVEAVEVSGEGGTWLKVESAAHGTLFLPVVKSGETLFVKLAPKDEGVAFVPSSLASLPRGTWFRWGAWTFAANEAHVNAWTHAHASTRGADFLAVELTFGSNGWYRIAEADKEFVVWSSSDRSSQTLDLRAWEKDPVGAIQQVPEHHLEAVIKVIGIGNVTFVSLEGGLRLHKHKQFKFTVEGAFECL